MRFHVLAPMLCRVTWQVLEASKLLGSMNARPINQLISDGKNPLATRNHKESNKAGKLACWPRVQLMPRVSVDIHRTRWVKSHKHPLMRSLSDSLKQLAKALAHKVVSRSASYQTQSCQGRQKDGRNLGKRTTPKTIPRISARTSPMGFGAVLSSPAKGLTFSWG